MKTKNISSYVLNSFLRKISEFGKDNKTDIFTIDELEELAKETEKTLKIKVKKKTVTTGDYEYNRYEQNR